jgi:hypothetical protein
LVQVLLSLEPDNLNETFRKEKNIALASFVKAAEEGNPEPLLYVFHGLKPKVLNMVLTNVTNGVLDFLVKEAKAKDGHVEALVWVFNYPNSEDRKDLLINSKTEVLACL